MHEEREDVEENEEERDRCDDFLSGTGGFGLFGPRDFCLDSGVGDEGKKGACVDENGKRGFGVSGEEGVMGEDTGVPGVGVLD